jgi:hypothetical protein
MMIPKGYNPVTLGLCIQAYNVLAKVFPDRKAEFNEKIDTLVAELESMIPAGYHGACWGYDFPWEARYTSIPAGQPTVVATGIITNALFSYYHVTGNTNAGSLVKSAADFVIHDLNRSYSGDSFCFSYSPFDSQQVYNASAKGARLLAQAYSLTGKYDYKSTARMAIEFIMTRQEPDGSWYYSHSGKWVDNYHTGYILDCLDDYRLYTGDETISTGLEKGFTYYKSHFTTPEGIPRFFPDKTFPVDCTAAGQLLLTLCRFQEQEIALRTAIWMIRNMQSGKGYFYYRKYPGMLQKTSFMRWSNAWMLAGLSYLAEKLDFSSIG